VNHGANRPPNAGPQGGARTLSCLTGYEWLGLILGDRCSCTITGMLAVAGILPSGLLAAQAIDSGSVREGTYLETQSQVNWLASDNDRAYILSLASYCSERSPTFRVGLTAVNNDSTRVTLKLGRNFFSPPGVLFDQWGRDEQTIDLDDLDLLPPFHGANGAWTMGTAPSWSPTKCGLLGHFVIEAWYIQSRLAAASPRLALPADAFASVAHQRAREFEEAVEAEMGRAATKTCNESIESTDGTTWFLIHLSDTVTARRYEVRFQEVGIATFLPPQYCGPPFTCRPLLRPQGVKACWQ